MISKALITTGKNPSPGICQSPKFNSNDSLTNEIPTTMRKIARVLSLNILYIIYRLDCAVKFMLTLGMSTKDKNAIILASALLVFFLFIIFYNW